MILQGKKIQKVIKKLAFLFEAVDDNLDMDQLGLNDFKMNTIAEFEIPKLFELEVALTKLNLLFDIEQLSNIVAFDVFVVRVDIIGAEVLKVVVL